MYECVICKVKFQASLEFEAHFEYFHKKSTNGIDVKSDSHSTDYNCDVCEKVFASKGALEKHGTQFHNDILGDIFN